MKPTKANHRTQSDSTNGKRQTRRSATKNKYYLGAVLERQLPGTFSPSAKALGIHHPPSAPTAAPAPTRSLHLAETRQQTKHRFRRRRKYFKDPRMAEAAAPIAKSLLLFQTSKPRRGVRLSPRGTPTLCSLLALVALQSRQSHKHVPPYDLAVPYFPPRTRTNYAADKCHAPVLPVSPVLDAASRHRFLGARQQYKRGAEARRGTSLAPPSSPSSPLETYLQSMQASSESHHPPDGFSISFVCLFLAHAMRPNATPATSIGTLATSTT